MQIHVYDTYVQAKDGHTMHFDVFMPARDGAKAVGFAKEWLKSIGEGDATVTQEECRFCHTQGAPAHVEAEIQSKGYYIYKMDGCPK